MVQTRTNKKIIRCFRWSAFAPSQLSLNFTSSLEVAAVLSLACILSPPSTYSILSFVYSSMALKRKFSADFEDSDAGAVGRPNECRELPKLVFTSSTLVQTPKQPRLLVPFPNSQLESDVNMSDVSAMDLAPLSIPTQMFHSRLSSNASTTSYGSLDSPHSSRKLTIGFRSHCAETLLPQRCTLHSTSTPMTRSRIKCLSTQVTTLTAQLNQARNPLASFNPREPHSLIMGR